MAGPRILLAGGGTGGHLFPALNLAAALRRAEPDVSLLMIGARRGVEARVLPQESVPYELLPLHPIYRSRPWRNWKLAAAAFPISRTLRRTFQRFDPQLVVGTGGYASGPALLAALLYRRPTALQEQNANPGMVTTWLAPYVDQIHLGYPEARILLKPGPSTRVFTLGNPVAEPSPAGSETATYDWPAGRVVAVIGGSQGALGINERLLADLEHTQDWPPDVSLVWIAGPSHAERVRTAVERLPYRDRIHVLPFLRGLGSQMDRITLAISRAGAMTTSELAVAGTPSILVPLPSAAADHQTRNAMALDRAGGARMLEEQKLRPGELWDTVLALLSSPDRLSVMAEIMRGRGRPDAANRIASEMLRLVSAERFADGGDHG